MKEIIQSIIVIASIIFCAFGLFFKFRGDRQFDQASDHIPPAAQAIKSENYYQALAELKEIDRPTSVITAAMAYCIYKTDGKSAAIRTIKDFLAKNDVNENDRQFLLTLIDDISSGDISTFILDYTTHNDSRREKLKINVRYY